MGPGALDWGSRPPPNLDLLFGLLQFLDPLINPKVIWLTSHDKTLLLSTILNTDTGNAAQVAFIGSHLSLLTCDVDLST